MSKPYEHYTEDFKKKVVQLVESGKRRSEVARAYGISAPNIRVWQQKYGSLATQTNKENNDDKTITSK
ncbi:MAG: helix-turn-helix domain-containing protein [Firmicutes bacterium]|nr:helix-turn-helix domain-containing protein [Bacillota bacterium]